jgi:carboxyl-terminal processing protease
MSAFTGRRLLHGAPGSKVTLQVVRTNLADPHEFTLVRETPPSDSASLVAVKSAAGQGAHVRLTSFGKGATDALKQTFLKLQKDGVKGAVLDLRGISDGTPEDGIAAARIFLKSGTIGIRAGRGQDKTTFTAQAGDGAVTVPLVLLVSSGTANAAEVLTAALAGNDRAEIVGEQTAGVAAEQKLVTLAEGRGLLLTHRHYLLADGSAPIHGNGVRPTVGVEIPAPGFDELAPAEDVPLAKALEQLRKKYSL